MPERSRTSLGRTAIVVAVVTAAFVLAHGPGVLLGRELFFTHDVDGSDLWHLHYPLKHFYAEELRAGRLPLWCDEIGTGFPLLAEGQVGALYPPNLLLFGLLPLPVAFNASILLGTLLAGLFAAALARELGAGTGGSVLAAVVFAFSGCLTVHLKHVNMVAAAAWSPLLLLAVERYARRLRSEIAAGFAVAVAAMTLAGHPQIAYDNLLVAGAYALVRMVFPVGALGEGERAGSMRRLKFGLGLACATMLGILLAAPQILPTLELNRLGPRRAGLPFDEAFAFDVSPAELVTFVAPKAFGDPGSLMETTRVDPSTGVSATRWRGFAPPSGARAPFWEITAYVGLLPLPLAGLALLARPSRRALAPLAGVLALSLVLALGRHGGLAPILHALLPGFRYFRFHGRFLFYVDLALAVLAGVGLTRLGDRASRARRVWPRRLLPAAAIAIAFLDLHHALGDQNPRLPAGRWTTPPDTALKMRVEAPRGPTPFRMVDVDPDRFVFLNAYRRARGWNGDLSPYEPAHRMLNSNLNVLYDLDDIDFYFYIYPERLRLAALAVLDTESGVDEKGASLFNVRFLLKLRRGGSPGGEVVATFRGDAIAGAAGDRYDIDLIENRKAFPRAFLVPSARYVPPLDGTASPAEEAATLARVRDPGFAPSREVLVEGVPRPGDPAPSGAFPGPTEATIVTYEPQRVRVRVESPRSAWLVLTDTWYPGWRAEVDGAPVAIRPADLSVRAVPVPAGRHEVVFTYAPTSLRVGWLLAAAGAIGVIGWPIVSSRRGASL